MLAWREHPAARAEYLDALVWYDDQWAGLGDRLADSLEAAVDFMREWPEAAPLSHERHNLPVVRRKSVDDGFPYGVVYFVKGRELIVIAYAHDRRRPQYWRGRLEDV